MKWCVALLLAAAGAMAAEATAAPDRPGDVQLMLRALDGSAATRGQSPAIAALVDTAERELASGQPQQAVAPLERALGIEPHNASLWHRLARVHLELGNYAQAEAMAAKSRNLAGGDPALRTLNAGLAAAAMRAQGKPVPPPGASQRFASQSRFDMELEQAMADVDRDPRHAALDAPQAESRIPAWIRESRPARRAERFEGEQAPQPNGCRLSSRRQVGCAAFDRQGAHPASSSAVERRAERRYARRYDWSGLGG